MLTQATGGRLYRTDSADALTSIYAHVRAELARTRPWLIPELYNDKHEDTTAVADWVENLEQFVHDYETEIGMMVGGAPSLAFDPARPGAYRDAVRDLLTMASAPDAGKAVTVQLFDRTTKKNDKGNDVTHYTYTPRIATAGQALKDMASFTDSSRVPYWKAVIDLDVKEAACLKANSDMGMCQLVRALYLYGSLPSTLGSDSQLTWRGIPAPTGQFDDFVATRRTDPALRADDQLQQRFDVATAKLRLLLEPRVELELGLEPVQHRRTTACPSIR